MNRLKILVFVLSYILLSLGFAFVGLKIGMGVIFIVGGMQFLDMLFDE